MRFGLLVLLAVICRTSWGVRHPSSSLTQLRAYTLSDCIGTNAAAQSAACELARYVALAEQAGYVDLGTASTNVYFAQQNNNQSLAYLQGIPSTNVNQNLSATLPMALNDLGRALTPAIANLYYMTNQSVVQTNSMVATMGSNFNQTMAALTALIISALNGENAVDLNSVNALLATANALNLNSSLTPVFASLTSFLNQVSPALTLQLANVRKADTQIQNLLMTLPVSLGTTGASFSSNFTAVKTRASSSLASNLAALRNSTTSSYTFMASSTIGQVPAANATVGSQVNLWTAGRLAEISAKKSGAAKTFAQLSGQMAQLNATVRSTSSATVAAIQAATNATLNNTNAINQLLTNTLVSMNAQIRNSSTAPEEVWDQKAEARLGSLSDALEAVKSQIEQDLANGTSTSNVSNSLLASMSAVGSEQQTLNDQLANQTMASVDAMHNLTQMINNQGTNVSQLFTQITQLSNTLGSQLGGNITAAGQNATNVIASTLDGIQSQAVMAMDETNQALAAVNNNLSDVSTLVNNMLDDYEQVVRVNVSSAADNTARVQAAVTVATNTAAQELANLTARIAQLDANMSLQANGALSANQVTLGSLGSIANQTNGGIAALVDSVSQKQSDLADLFASVSDSFGLDSVTLPNLAGDAASSLGSFQASQNETANNIHQRLSQVVNSVDTATSSVRQNMNQLIVDATLNSSDYITALNSSLASILSNFNSSFNGPYRGLDSLSSSVAAQLVTWIPSDTLQSISALQTRLQSLQQALSDNDIAMDVLNGSLMAQVNAVNISQSNDVASIQTLLDAAAQIDSYLNGEAAVLSAELTTQNASNWAQIMNSSLQFNLTDAVQAEMNVWSSNTTRLNASLVANMKPWLAGSVKDAREADVPVTLAAYNTTAQALLTNESSYLHNATSASSNVLADLTHQLTAIRNSVNSSMPGWLATTSSLRASLQTVAQTVDASVATATDATQGLASTLASQLSNGTSAANAMRLQGQTDAALSGAGASVDQGIEVTDSFGSIVNANLAARQNMVGSVANQIATTSSLIDGIVGSALSNVTSNPIGVNGSSVSLSDISTMVSAYLTLANAVTTSLSMASTNTDAALASASSDVQRQLGDVSRKSLDTNAWLRGAIGDIAEKDLDLNELVDRMQTDTAALQSSIASVSFPTDINLAPISALAPSNAEITEIEFNESTNLESLASQITAMIQSAT